MIYLGFLIALYFLPCLWAYYAKHPKADQILLLNVFLGWTFIGWVIALIWAAGAKK